MSQVPSVLYTESFVTQTMHKHPKNKQLMLLNRKSLLQIVLKFPSIPTGLKLAGLRSIFHVNGAILCDEVLYYVPYFKKSNPRTNIKSCHHNLKFSWAKAAVSFFSSFEQNISTYFNCHEYEKLLKPSHSLIFMYTPTHLFFSCFIHGLYY